MQEPLTAAVVAQAVNGRIVRGTAATPLAGVSIDSRTMSGGELFVALRGERFDGHAFIDAAIDRGASALLVSRVPMIAGGDRGVEPAVIQVPDTLLALQALGRYVRRASGAQVVAITGSAGKTTTKEIAAEFLAVRYRVFRNSGNLNNHIGLPLSLTLLWQAPEIAVVELGMNHAGEIRTLIGIAEPQVRVWTNVAEAHAAFFPSIEHIADAKAEILEQASPGDLLVANADDPRVMARAPRFIGRIRTFGITRPADVMASDVHDLGVEGMAARLSTAAGEAALRIPLLGRGNLANVLAATAVALHYEIPLDAIVTRARSLAPVERRGQILRLRRGLIVIDDSYNSNPAALEGALDVLAREGQSTRRIAVLGEMLELGAQAVPLHERAGRAAARAKLDLLVTVGGDAARALGRSAVAAGLDAARALHAHSSEQAADLVAGVVRVGDLVLVKGSRGIRTEVVVERLRGEWA